MTLYLAVAALSARSPDNLRPREFYRGWSEYGERDRFLHGENHLAAFELTAAGKDEAYIARAAPLKSAAI
jgi:hypothetical protein